MQFCLHDMRVGGGAGSFRHAAVVGLALLGACGIGHRSVIVLAGTFTRAVERFLGWIGSARPLRVVWIACGVLVLLAGWWLIHIAP